MLLRSLRLEPLFYRLWEASVEHKPKGTNHDIKPMKYQQQETRIRGLLTEVLTKRYICQGWLARLDDTGDRNENSKNRVLTTTGTAQDLPLVRGRHSCRTLL